jgi:hypothetical protein
MKVGRFLIATILGGAMTACSAPRSTPPRVPALEYTRALNQPISPTEASERATKRAR